MARSVEEIFKYLNNKEQVIKDFSGIAYNIGCWVPHNQDISSVSNDDINSNESKLMKAIQKGRLDAKKILYELDRDFKDAISSVSEDKRAAVTAEYNEKRQLVSDGVEMIMAHGEHIKELWEKAKQGNTIQLEEKYDKLKKFEAKAKNEVSHDDKTKDGSDEEEIIAAEEDARREDEEEEINEGDLSTEESKTVLQLMKELRDVRAARRRAEKALTKQRFKEFGDSIEESGAAYLQAKDAKEKYKARMKELKGTYKRRYEQIDADEIATEDKLDEDRAKLAENKGKLHDIRKQPVIRYLEKAVKDKAKLEKQLKQAKSDEEKTIIQDKINNADATITRMRATPEGQEYTKIQGDIETTKVEISEGKQNLEQIKVLRQELDDWIKTYTEKAKADRDNKLPEKQSKFKMFIGAIRAKLGIGKYKAEKNAKDSIDNAISSATGFLTGVGNRISEVHENVKTSVKGFFTDKAEKAINALENHINNRIASEKGKTEEIKQKIKPEGAER